MWNTEYIISAVLPPIIGILEIIGIFVVVMSAVSAFWGYLQNTFLHKHFDIQWKLGQGLATALEFKMAAEILKTLLIHELNELLILGAVIILRALLSFLIHYEMKHHQATEHHSLKGKIQ